MKGSGVELSGASEHHEKNEKYNTSMCRQLSGMCVA